MFEKLISIKSWEDIFKYGGHLFTILFLSTAFTGTTAESAGNILRNMAFFYVFFLGARSMNDEDLNEKERFEYLKQNTWIIPITAVCFLIGFFLL
ncbi:MAG: hypothetical protein BRC29_03390 [Nanohaloarchaea archaeon SW_7_43_1]|nr:MAG: hypothetical protein BRC29_03390 [Nanohaloarchaea archaeon SW_7_43_1]